MPSPAEIPQRDEALKSLVEKFEAAPASRAFVDLAAALLARGHASESLRVAEHGLQLVPMDADGRVERAAALLALGRPRVAYVELLRALALAPSHKRGMRLLGKAFRDAGAPHRAAELLAQRSKRAASEVSSTIEAHPPEPETLKSRPAIDTASEARPTSDPMPALFSALTKDLGLGGAVPSRKAPPRVEVTQIMRRKRAPRPPRSESELVEIDGPIVDTTQPGKVEALDLEDEPADVTAREPAPLWHDRTPGLTDFALDDEPLFQENMPFAVRPVAGESSTPPNQPIDAVRPVAPTSTDLEDPGDTVVDEIESAGGPLESPGLPPGPTPMSLTELPGPPPEAAKAPPRPSTSDLELPSLAGGGAPEARPSEPKRSPPPPTLSGDLPPTPAPPERAAPTVPMGRRPDPRAPTNLLPPKDDAPGELGDDRPFEGAGAIVEKAARGGGGLTVTAPAPAKGRVALAGLAAVLMLAYVLGLYWLSADTLSVWWSDAPKGRAAVEGGVDSSGARAQRP